MIRLKQFTLITFLLFSFVKNISASFSTVVFSEEDCYNGINDDGDGLIDMADPDCFCEEATYLATNLYSEYSM